ncbi:hypothetical protein L6452_02772 [Arctium lappa]|uniref:Uncharacterized protein n=1 Tax=Arctium lappa TaxID=4217 RepID=A0ACB9FKV7_ARCLA|nr:hypothetical protein L6452_02772 [Arctium lappa]
MRVNYNLFPKTIRLTLVFFARGVSSKYGIYSTICMDSVTYLVGGADLDSFSYVEVLDSISDSRRRSQGKTQREFLETEITAKTNLEDEAVKVVAFTDCGFGFSRDRGVGGFDDRDDLHLLLQNTES